MFTTADLFGRFHSPRAPLQAARDQIAATSLNGLSILLAAWFPRWLLAPAEEGPHSRRRIYSLYVTFWTFLWQVLNPGQPCRQAVRKVIAWFKLQGGPPVPEDDSPYCQARRRLPRPTLERILQASAQAADQRARQHWRFHGREVKVGDGTTVLMPDTPANQSAYPQSARQAPGCGFPLLKLVALFSLTSGALLAVVTGNKHRSELALFRRLWRQLQAGDIFLADRGFCDYVTLVALKIFGVDVVLRLNASRPHDFRQGQRLGRYDRLVTWEKPTRQPRTVSKKQGRTLPVDFTLRLIRYPVTIRGFRPTEICLVTTLLDPIAYPVAELAGLYGRRWRVELFLRHLKTTLQMERLSCKSPAMVRKELLMHLLAYNLIRCVMVEAAGIYEVNLEQLSFKGALDTVREFCPTILLAKSRAQRRNLIQALWSALAHDLLPNRPHRVEPRVQKRRPKAFPFLCRPRQELKARLLKQNNRQKSKP
jgi:hypothetical protein